MLALLTLLQTLCQFGFLLPLEQGLIEPLGRIVVPLEYLQFLIPHWRIFNALLVERYGLQYLLFLSVQGLEFCIQRVELFLELLRVRILQRPCGLLWVLFIIYQCYFFG